MNSYVEKFRIEDKTRVEILPGSNYRNIEGDLSRFDTTPRGVGRVATPEELRLYLRERFNSFVDKPKTR